MKRKTTWAQRKARIIEKYLGSCRFVCQVKRGDSVFLIIDSTLAMEVARSKYEAGAGVVRIDLNEVAQRIEREGDRIEKFLFCPAPDAKAGR